jgi:site-specific recombinase XerD
MEQHGDDTHWRVCYTKLHRRMCGPRSALLAGYPDLSEREQSLGIRPDHPFLLAPFGQPDIDVLEFFRSPSFYALAADSRASYALDLKVFLSFLSVQGIDWRAATESHVADFEYWRRRDDRNTARVSAAKFSRELAAIGKFYVWQQRRGVVKSSPVALRERKLPSGDTATRPALRPRSVRSVRLKWLTPRAYRRWRDIGLGGYLADGTRDAKWRGRNDGRNLALAETLWSSGLRLREGGTLLLAELPGFGDGIHYAKGRLAQAAAKGRGRDFWIHCGALKHIDNYRISTRQEAVCRARREGRYQELAEILVVNKVDRNRRVHFVSPSGDCGVVPLDDLDWRDRLKFFIRGDDGLEPWMLWLSENGLPMPYRTWEAVFSTANKRCNDLDVDIHCHPHMLRHSFALRMLMTLIYAHDRRMGITPAERREYRHIFGDPWVLVQTMLGHANLETTRDCYLEPVSGLQVELFLNDEASEDSSINDLITRVAEASPTIIDVKD